MDVFVAILEYLTGFEFVLFVTVLILCFSQQKRKYFVARILGCAAVYFVPTFFDIDGVKWTMFVFFDFFALGCILQCILLLAMLLLCFKMKLGEALFYFCAGFGIYDLYRGIEFWALHKYFELFVLTEAFLSLFILFVVVAVTLFVIKRRKFIIDEGTAHFYVLLIFIFIDYITYLRSALWGLEGDTLSLAWASAIYTSLAVLFMQFGILVISRLQKEKAMIEQLIVTNESYRKTQNEIIDAVNIKCHDLKHQLGLLSAQDGESNRKWVNEANQTIFEYESLAHTGNQTLDSLLNLKMIICQKYNINFTFMADANDIDWIDVGDVFSLFGNALDNAIECEQRMAENNRHMALNVKKRGGFLSIHLDNYCDEKVEFDGSIPKSKKGDSLNHGFGIKSIKYIVEKYGGNMTVKHDGVMFILDILLPIPQETGGGVKLIIRSD